MKASVVLLTKNGGELLKDCVAAVCSQRFAEPFEIVAIDSGSRDGTTEVLRANPRVTFIPIDPSEFQHGRTRNMAMQRAKGELVCFLTQDAVPASDEWLAQFVAFMVAHPEVAGAFGHQVAHDGADPIEAWEVACHFDSFRGEPAVIKRPADGEMPGDDERRARIHYFSNVNSCIRRTAWERLPFPEVDFGEDQAWAFRIQQAGLAIGYAERAVVRHSHDYGPVKLFRRRYDEARFMKREFGYSLMPSFAEARRVAAAHSAVFREQLAGRTSWFHAAARAWASSLGRFAGTRLASSDGLLHSLFSLAQSQLRE